MLNIFTAGGPVWDSTLVKCNEAIIPGNGFSNYLPQKTWDMATTENNKNYYVGDRYIFTTRRMQVDNMVCPSNASALLSVHLSCLVKCKLYCQRILSAVSLSVQIN